MSQMSHPATATGCMDCDRQDIRGAVMTKSTQRRKTLPYVAKFLARTNSRLDFEQSIWYPLFPIVKLSGFANPIFCLVDLTS